MYKKSYTKLGLAVAAIFAAFLAITPQKAISAEVSIVTINSFEKDYCEQTKNLDKINSDQFVYPNENNKRNQILNNFFKNKSLSVSIPLQHKRRSTDIIANNEKKVIKHLNIQSN